MNTSDPIARRLEIARRVALAFQANDRVAGVLVAGSVARGLADDASDIELDVYWHQPPNTADREAAVEGAGWERVYAEEDEHECADGLMADGVKIDVSGFVTSTIDGYIDRARQGDTEAELQVRITALQRRGHPPRRAGHRRVARTLPALPGASRRRHGGAGARPALAGAARDARRPR